jgi:ABC-2 type transport system ATP-binding protein
MSAIEVTGISKNYGAVKALSQVSFSVGKGDVIGLLGPNGAGKTTLMKILTGYLEPDAGDAAIHGVDVVANPLGAQRHIGYLPESAPLYGEMLVQEYLEMMAVLRGVEPALRRTRISYAVRSVGLVDMLTRPIDTLSKGYRQRVGLAQAIVHKPQILILDEPTSGLDPTQIVEIRDLIRRLAAETTVLLSTHILTEVEATCERALVIMHGQLRADAKLAELRNAHAALVSIEATADGVASTLGAIPGVERVEDSGIAEGLLGYRRWRVIAREREDLCPAVFAAVKERGWNLAELRPDPKTLERVFRDLAQAAEEVAA